MSAALLLALGVVLPAQLRQAVVDVRLEGGEARAEAVYVLHGEALPAFRTVRQPAQQVEVLEPAGAELRRLPGLLLLRVPAAAAAGPDPVEVRIRYRVTGSLERLPLFVPDSPPDALATRVDVRVHGLPPGRSLSGTFPRLRREADGVAAAATTNLPTFLVLPAPGAFPGFGRVADVFTVLAILLAAVWWWRRFRPRELR